jgi:hypothetical protein
MADDRAPTAPPPSAHSWDIDPRYVTEGGVFASKAHKTPTLTIMALAWRSSEYLADQLGKRAL